MSSFGGQLTEVPNRILEAAVELAIAASLIVWVGELNIHGGELDGHSGYGERRRRRMGGMSEDKWWWARTKRKNKNTFPEVPRSLNPCLFNKPPRPPPTTR